MALPSFCSEITFDEFNKLLREMAPRYKKSASVDEAVAEMQQKIAKGNPSTSGTTVSFAVPQ